MALQQLQFLTKSYSRKCSTIASFFISNLYYFIWYFMRADSSYVFNVPLRFFPCRLLYCTAWRVNIPCLYEYHISHVGPLVSGSYAMMVAQWRRPYKSRLCWWSWHLSYSSCWGSLAGLSFPVTSNLRFFYHLNRKCVSCSPNHSASPYHYKTSHVLMN